MTGIEALQLLGRKLAEAERERDAAIAEFAALRSKLQDTEARDIIAGLPRRPITAGPEAPNAFVYVDNMDPPRLCILPDDGGWLGIVASSPAIEGDAAPFSD